MPGVVPSILSTKCKDHIQWIKTVFEAEQLELYMSEDDKTVMHCVLGLNGGYLFLGQPMEELGQADPETPAGFMLSLALDSPSDVWNRATSNQATVVTELAVQECGNQFGCFQDPYGFSWGVGNVTDKSVPGVVPSILRDGDCEEHIQW